MSKGDLTITNMKVKDFLALPELFDFSDKLFVPLPPVLEFFVRQASLGAQDRSSPHADILKGLNRIVALRRAGFPVYYAIDESKSEYLFHFPGRDGAKCVVVVPGGGYASVCSLWEGFPVAARLNELGYHAVVANYRTGKEAHFPNPHDDLAAAIRFMLDHAKEWKLDASGYALMGFSAGGHLAGSFATSAVGYAKYNLPKPACMMLSYPVVTMGEQTHRDSRRNLLGKENVSNAELIARYSIERQVTPDYPKTFLWQCERDNVVPFENAKLLKSAFDRCGVRYAFESFQSNAHGWGLAKGQPADGWLDRAVAFWEAAYTRNTETRKDRTT